MEAILAARISYIARTNNLLPKTHFGGRYRSCVETAIHYLPEQIYAAWNKNETTSLLMMDVSPAYLNISHQRLLHNLRKKRIDIKVVGLVALFWTNCQTIIKTNEYTKPKLFIDLGFPQGWPLSFILYLFYNRNLLDHWDKKGVDAQGYTDNITLITKRKSVKGNNQQLAKVYNQVWESWKMKHGSEFRLPKYQLIHISRKRNINYTTDVRLRRSHLIQGASTAGNLGMTLQSTLKWKDQISKIKEKAVKSIGAPLSITRSTWRANYLALRKIFKTLIIPQITYGTSIWYTPIADKRDQKTLVLQLAKVQAFAACLITGVYKATSAQVLNVEAYLIPIGLELDKRINQTAARLCSGHLYLPLTPRWSTNSRRILTTLEVFEKR